VKYVQYIETIKNVQGYRVTNGSARELEEEEQEEEDVRR